jgi:hypothetical protein
MKRFFRTDRDIDHMPVFPQSLIGQGHQEMKVRKICSAVCGGLCINCRTGPRQIENLRFTVRTCPLPSVFGATARLFARDGI